MHTSIHTPSTQGMVSPPAGVEDITAACVHLCHNGGKGKVDTGWRASQASFTISFKLGVSASAMA